MIIKKRTKPIRLQVEEALFRRLPQNHPAKASLAESIKKRKAGYRGEQILDYYLSLLPHDQYFIFNDLRIIHKNNPFQIDTLILSEKFIFLIETKHITGTLIFDETHQQFIRHYENKEERFQYPLTQAKLQLFQLQSWLSSHKLPLVPIDFSIVNTNASSIIKTSSIHKLPVFHVEQLVEKIHETEEAYKEKYKIQKINFIKNLLLDNHFSGTIDIEKTYNISQSEVLRGVQCSNCSFLPMSRKQGTWICKKCKTSDKYAHEQAILDYLLLIKPTISNKQCRDFLLLSSAKITKSMLQNMNLKREGKCGGTIYMESNK